MLLAALITSLAVSLLTNLLSVRNANARYMLDKPNHRSMHTRPVPRSGGIGILLGVFAGCIWLLPMSEASNELRLFFIGALILFGVALWDDFGHVAARLRLMVQMLAALCLLFALPDGALVKIFDLPHELTLIGSVLLVLTTIWSINLYNFMDGMDGFAAGMTLVGFSGYGLLGFMAGVDFFTAAAWVIVAATLAFLLFNLPTARIFMGDTGSTVLGYLAAGFGFWGVSLDAFSVWVPLILFSPFWVDATVTLLKRIGRSERIWEAHRSHYYQQLALSRLGVKKTLLIEYSLMAGCLLTVYLSVTASSTLQAALLGVWCVIYIAFFMLINHFELDK